jgi:GGDEF domain-containing protein
VAAWNEAPAAGGLGECAALVRSAEALRFSAPELAVQLARRALAVGAAEPADATDVGQARTLSMRAQAVLAAGLVRTSHHVDAVEPAFAALALADGEGEPEVAVAVRLDLAACSREVGEPLLGCAMLRPVLETDQPRPSVRAVALGRLVGCIAHVGRRDDLEDALTEADRLLAADDGLSPDARRMERARLSVRAAAYHRWYGDTEDAADAAREGLTQLNRLRGMRADAQRLRAQLVLELVCALLDEGALEEAVSVSEAVLAEPVRATSAAAVGQLMLAVSTRVHLPSGRVERGRGLLDQAVWLGGRHALDGVLADALTVVSQLDEAAGRTTDALESLRGARAAEQRRLRALSQAARHLLTEADATKWDAKAVNALLRQVIRPPGHPIAAPSRALLLTDAHTSQQDPEHTGGRRHAQPATEPEEHTAGRPSHPESWPTEETAESASRRSAQQSGHRSGAWSGEAAESSGRRFAQSPSAGDQRAQPSSRSGDEGAERAGRRFRQAAGADETPRSDRPGQQDSWPPDEPAAERTGRRFALPASSGAESGRLEAPTADEEAAEYTGRRRAQPNESSFVERPVAETHGHQPEQRTSEPAVWPSEQPTGHDESSAAQGDPAATHTEPPARRDGAAARSADYGDPAALDGRSGSATTSAGGSPGYADSTAAHASPATSRDDSTEPLSADRGDPAVHAGSAASFAGRSPGAASDASPAAARDDSAAHPTARGDATTWPDSAAANASPAEARDGSVAAHSADPDVTAAHAVSFGGRADSAAAVAGESSGYADSAPAHTSSGAARDGSAAAHADSTAAHASPAAVRDGSVAAHSADPDVTAAHAVSFGGRADSAAAVAGGPSGYADSAAAHASPAAAESADPDVTAAHAIPLGRADSAAAHASPDAARGDAPAGEPSAGELVSATADRLPQSETDAATGLLNKDGLIRRLRAVRNGERPVALTLVRLDSEVGRGRLANPGTRPGSATDFELSELAGRVRNIAPDDAELARSDGTELAVLLPHTTRDQAEKFAAAIESAWLGTANGHNISTGVVQSNPDAPTVDARALINAARHALTPAIAAPRGPFGTQPDLDDADPADTLRIGRAIISSLSIPAGSGGRRRADDGAPEPAAEDTGTNSARPGDAEPTTPQRDDSSTYEQTKADLARLMSALTGGGTQVPAADPPPTPLPAPSRPTEDHARNGTSQSIPTPPEPDEIPDPKPRPDIPDPGEPEPIPPAPPDPGPEPPDEPGPLTPPSAVMPSRRRSRLAAAFGAYDDPQTTTSSDPASANTAGKGDDNPASTTSAGDERAPRTTSRGLAAAFGGSRGDTTRRPSMAAAFGESAETTSGEQAEPGTRRGERSSATIAGLLAEALAAYQETTDEPEPEKPTPAPEADNDFDRLFDWRYQSPASGRHRSPE